MIEPPIRPARGEAAGQQAAVGVAVRGEQELRRVERVEQSGDRVGEPDGLAVSRVEHVRTVLVDHADVHVLAAAAVLGVGLGHEGREQSLVEGGPIDRAAEQHRLVRRAYRVVAVGEVDLELSRSDLGERGLRRYAERVGVVPDSRQHTLHPVRRPRLAELDVPVGAGHAQSLRYRWPPARARARVEEVELELHGHHRPPAAPGEARRLSSEHSARVEGARLAVLAVQRGEHLEPVLVPGLADERARLDQAAPVRIADRQAESGQLVAILVADVLGLRRQRQPRLPALDLRVLRRRYALGAQAAVPVDDEHVDVTGTLEIVPAHRVSVAARLASRGSRCMSPADQ